MGTAKTYIGKRPCKHGVIGPRLMSGHCRCKDCKAEIAAKVREWQKSNPKKQLELVKKWQAKNREKVIKIQKAVKEKRRLSGKESKWRRENAASINARNQKRRARRLCATPPWFGEIDELVMSEAADLCLRRKELTGYVWHVDHMIPLQAREACGLHITANIQVIPASTNAWKHNRMVLTRPLEWLRAI